MSCPFCAPETDRVFLRLTHVFALWDAFPVGDGHALIVPTRHMPTWFDATPEERTALFTAIEPVCSLIRSRWQTDGFNIGINIGPSAGQTVPHLHLHVIPRRNGDVADPRGGVRHVIPGKGNYLSLREWPDTQASDRESKPVGMSTPAPRAYEVAEPKASQMLLTTGGEYPLLPLLEEDLASATQVDIAVAFVMPSGVERLYPHVEDLLVRRGRLRLLAGDYLDISDPDALQRLLDLRTLYYGSDRCELRVFQSQGTSFHPKAYLVTRAGGRGVAYVGSSNLSESALAGGIEWNYRVLSDRDADGLQQVRDAFHALFRHQQTRELDQAWLDQYRARRESRPLSSTQLDDVERELPPLVPVPNRVQQEALDALQRTRAEGNRAGLVVMATGLGKTWLAAFDVNRVEFRRVLFVAHREEILAQALATFRRIRPQSRLGLYNGGERVPDADVLFASVQTLSRRDHLERFAPDAFDYMIVDEFHHASAATYRLLIDHFEPAFLLGLTATPERSDGGDLLAICDENLVYRCGVPRGIEMGLLCPYVYFGVPDDVDYRNIPWRSSRFDEKALTEAVATDRRARNILEQWKARGGDKTLAFCVSQTHADFMRQYFREAGVSCAAVHSGPTSDQRAASLEKLAAGDIKVVFAVDMFNEGVDVPAIDTVMMLRPTESQIIWLQQFGRGLRKYGDKRLRVIDYIGNHRAFLLKLRTLLALHHATKQDLKAALDRAQRGELDLPPGCDVTYDLQAIDILRALLPPGTASDTLREYYVDFRERHGQRPTASQAFHDGYQPRAARNEHGSWLGFVRAMERWDGTTEEGFASARVFLEALEVTKMTRSYKMLVLQAMLNRDAIPGPGLRLDDLAREIRRIASRSSMLLEDLGVPVDDDRALRQLLVDNPIAAWIGEASVPGSRVFAFEQDRLRFVIDLPTRARSAFQQMVRELVEWRLAEYLSRHRVTSSGAAFIMNVSHTDGRPILFLPNRETVPGIPYGWHNVTVNGKPYQANFVKIAVNVVRLEGSDENVLPALLRGWFGPDAGLPGTNFRVSCTQSDDGWAWEPLGERKDQGPELHKRYSREQIPRLFGQDFSQAIWNVGFVVVTPKEPKHLCLLVTLGKSDMPEKFQYGDRFLSPDVFEWHSQNRTRRDSKTGQLIQDHERLGITVELFVRSEKKKAGGAAPFLYCGRLRFQSWQGDAPISVRWKLDTQLGDKLYAQFNN